MLSAPALPANGALSDEEVVRRVLTGETSLYEVIMRRYNQRLFRTALAIVRDADEAEDVMQDAYVRAYMHLNQFAGEAKFSTWLTRIAVHEALARCRKNRRNRQMATDPDGAAFDPPSNDPSPEIRASEKEAGALLESAIKALPRRYSSVLILRDVEGLSTLETAECLEIHEENVKIRLHRARRMLREILYAKAGVASASAFQFLGHRCDRTVERVLHRIRAITDSATTPIQ